MRYLLLLLLIGCVPDADPDGPPATPPPPCEDHCVGHDFGTTVVPASTERDGMCWSWTIGNAEPLRVNQVSMQNDGWFHHSNWFYVPDTVYPVPDGVWDCGAAGFTELGAAIFGGAIYAQTTQVEAEDQTFLPGAVVEIPANSRIIAAAHVLNFSTEDQETGLRVQLHTLDEADVEVELQPFRFTYLDLDIPADSDTAHTGDCDLETEHQAIHGEPLDLKLHYVLPHTHALGDSFTLEVSGGDADGQVVAEQLDLYGEPSGVTLEEPLDFGALGATGMRFTCGHRNYTDSWVGWGIDDQEMCVMLGFAEVDMRFDGTVSVTEDRSEGEVLGRTGACTVTGVVPL